MRTPRGRPSGETAECRNQRLATYVTPDELAAIGFMGGGRGHAWIIRTALANYAKTYHPDLVGRFRKDLR